MLWQQINPSFSFAVTASGVPFGTCHFDSLPPMLLSSSPLCLLASVDQRITSESREVKCARTSCRRVQMLLQKERGMRLCSAHVQCVRARLFTATSQDTTHLTCLLLALLRHWEFTAATVYMCARSPFINVLGLVTIYHPFLPWPSPSSGPLGSPLPTYFEHTSTCTVCAMHELLLDFILFICSKYLLI